MPRRRSDDYDDDDGSPLPRSTTSKPGISPLMIAALVVGIAIAPLLFGLVVYTIYQDAMAVATPPSAIKVELANLLTDWKANPIDTHERYKNKVIAFNGYVRDIDGDGDGGARLKITPDKDAGWLASSVRLRFRRELMPALRSYPVGSSITVEATIDEPDSALRATAQRIVTSR